MASKRELKARWRREPGRSIRERIIEFLRSLHHGHSRRSEELFSLLEGLPYREEVPNGRDLRGVDVAGGLALDFSHTDFYAASLSGFINCNVSGARFDEASGWRIDLGRIANGASYRRASVRGCYLVDAKAIACCFDEANLEGTRFENIDLRGSTFRNARCKRTAFLNANLIGCDCRGMKAEQACFLDVRIDRTTDIRGARFVNAYYQDQYDYSGKLVGRGVDWSLATHDVTTVFGKDDRALPIEVLTTALTMLSGDQRPEAKHTAEVIQSVLGSLRQTYREDWHRQIVHDLDDNERAFFDELIEDVFEQLR